MKPSAIELRCGYLILCHLFDLYFLNLGIQEGGAYKEPAKTTAPKKHKFPNHNRQDLDLLLSQFHSFHNIVEDVSKWCHYINELDGNEFSAPTIKVQIELFLQHDVLFSIASNDKNELFLVTTKNTPAASVRSFYRQSKLTPYEPKATPTKAMIDRLETLEDQAEALTDAIDKFKRDYNIRIPKKKKNSHVPPKKPLSPFTRSETHEIRELVSNMMRELRVVQEGIVPPLLQNSPFIVLPTRVVASAHLLQALQREDFQTVLERSDYFLCQEKFQLRKEPVDDDDEFEEEDDEPEDDGEDVPEYNESEHSFNNASIESFLNALFDEDKFRIDLLAPKAGGITFAIGIHHRNLDIPEAIAEFYFQQGFTVVNKVEDDEEEDD